jgi:hypothetical protein
MKQSRSLHLRTSQLAAVAISRTVEDGSLHVELASDRRDDAGRQITLDLTPAEAAALRDALAWWLDPTSAANASHLRMGVPADDAPRPPREQTAELRRRARFIKEGVWNDRVLVFLDREVHAERVTMLDGPGERAWLVGRDLATQQRVDYTFNPCDVKRVVG